MPRLSAPILALALALALSACGRNDPAFDSKVHAYLVAHPEVIQDAMDALQKKQEAVQAKQEADAEALTQKAIGPNRQAIERDPRDYVANPNGKITVGMPHSIATSMACKGPAPPYANNANCDKS